MEKHLPAGPESRKYVEKRDHHSKFAVEVQSKVWYYLGYFKGILRFLRSGTLFLFIFPMLRAADTLKRSRL
jgi:hypothetical protein